jgi:hypothetical protein
MEYRYLNVPKKAHRPSFDQITEFINFALKNDRPIAFLNLHNGKVVNLEAWHWTLIVESHLDSESGSTVMILDNGEKKTIDLRLWYDTTTNDGGFVYFANVNNQ